MKKIKILPLTLIAALMLAALAPGALAAESVEAPELGSAAAVIAEADTGRVLYELNADEQRYPASLTKVMTVLLAVEAIERGEASLDDTVTAGMEAIQGMYYAGSTSNIQAGEEMTLRDLMYCAMLGSANEACNIIAVHISGSLDAFVALMNERAAELGCTGTHFNNTHGLPDSDHYTTARDFTMITCEAMAHELFVEISGTVSYTVPATNMSGERRLSNTNGLINPESSTYPGYYYEYARAGKTGHTTDAGYCLASMAERDGIRLVCVVLGGVSQQNSDGSTAYTSFSDSRQLYNWVFNNFSTQEVLSTTEIVTRVQVNLAEDGGQTTLRPQSSISALMPNTGFNVSDFTRDVVIYSERDGETLTAPIAAGTVLGEVTVSLDGVVLGTSSLVTSTTVELARSEYMKSEIADFFSNIWVLIILAVLIVAVVLYVLSVVRYRKLHKRHLHSLEAARQREAERDAEHEDYFSPEPPPAEEPTTVMRNTGTHAGVKRTTGQHPGGIIVVPDDMSIYDFSPIQYPADDAEGGTITTHFDFNSLHDRLVKLDILGHDDPTMLRMLQDLTGIDPKTRPLDDPGVLSLFQSPKALGVTPEQIGSNTGTLGIPEFGTAFVRQMLEDTHPTTVSELIRIAGLSHGTDVWLNNAQEKVREGVTTLKECIATRDDIMLALIRYGVESKMAFDTMESVRKGKGLKPEMEAAMAEHNVPEWFVDSCKKIKYMFPKGHAAAYVMMSLRVAWYKVYQPKAYYTAYYTVRADEFDASIMCGSLEAVQEQINRIQQMGKEASAKDANVMIILELVREMLCRGIVFDPIDLYESDATRFLMTDTGIRPPLNAIPGLGSNAAQAIVQAREEGRFLSIEDLKKRGKVSSSVLESMKQFRILDGMTQTNQISLFDNL